MSGSKTDIRCFSKRTFRISGNDNLLQRRIQTTSQIGQFHDFTRFTRIGYKKQQVIFLQNSQIAMLSFTGVKKNSRNTRRTKSSSNVHGNLSGLSHSTGYQLSFFAVYLFYNQLNGLLVCICYGNIQYSLCFTLQQFVNR